jgi:hypothetical protein
VTEDEDVAIRTAVSDAINAIAERTLLTPSRLHYLFWNVFRACCKRDETHCSDCPSTCALPSRYVDLSLPDLRRCVFSDVCSSNGRADKMTEHFALTDFY